LSGASLRCLTGKTASSEEVPEMLTGTIVYAIINSVILMLMSIGFNLTFGISGISNFAYGALYILAAFVTYMLLQFVGLSYLVSALLSIVLTAILGALMYRFILMRVRGQVLSEVIATFGIGLAILEFFRYLGFVGVEYALPVFIDESFVIGDVYVDAQRIVIVAAGIILVVLLWLFVHYTSLGLAFRGIAQDERTALTFGMDSDKVATLSVSIGAGLAAIAATVIVPLGTISVSQGYDVLINALAVSIIGGLGSTGGVIVASLVVGFAQRFTDTYIGSHWTMIVSLVAILLVLVIKPSGLYGKQKELEERI
jgi:branched-chain amino acid transport system permease protein